MRLSEVATLYRPVGPGQLQCIIESGWARFPERKARQRYFYPMLHESFAKRVAGDWNVRNSGVGYVTRFKVKRTFLEYYPIYMVGGPEHREYRIDAKRLAQLNNNIVGKIEVIAVFGEPPFSEETGLFAGL
ncbi:MAG: ADP-ribosylation/crystallin J1 [Pseudomonadales bacterium]|nr:ADP-ribosylation/crystallin J1 [Pseudomonadales bacterium]